MNEILGSTVWLTDCFHQPGWEWYTSFIHCLQSVRFFCYLNFGRLKQVLNKVLNKIFMGCCLAANETAPTSVFIVKTCIESFPFHFSLVKKNGAKEVY